MHEVDSKSQYMNDLEEIKNRADNEHWEPSQTFEAQLRAAVRAYVRATGAQAIPELLDRLKN